MAGEQPARELLDVDWELLVVAFLFCWRFNELSNLIVWFVHEIHSKQIVVCMMFSAQDPSNKFDEVSPVMFNIVV